MPKSLPDPETTWTDDDARTVLAAWRRTEQPLGTFARENGMVANRLYWWRKRLSEPATVEFVPAVITGDVEVAVVVRIASMTIEIAKASPRAVAEFVVELVRSL